MAAQGSSAALSMLALPLANVLTGGKSGSLVGLLGVVLAIVMSQVCYVGTLARSLSLADLGDADLRHQPDHPGAGAAGDRSPATGLNTGHGRWVFYLVAICLTTLRNDGRLTLFTGTARWPNTPDWRWWSLPAHRIAWSRSTTAR